MEPDTPLLDDLAAMTQLVAIKAMRATSKKSNFVCSPYALTMSMLTMLPYMDMPGKKQVASLLGIKKQIRGLQEFMALADSINQRGTGQLSISNRVWSPADVRPESIPGRMIASGVGKLLSPVNMRSFYGVSDEIENWHRQQLGEYYSALGPFLDEGDLKGQPGFLTSNASGFRGGWELKFHNHLIGKSDFKTNFGQCLLTPFMQRGAIFRWDICPECKTLELDIESKSFLGRLGLVMMSPRYESLKDFENRISVDFYRWAVKRIIQVESLVMLPLFSIQTKKTFPQLFGNGVSLGALDESGSDSGRLLHKSSIVVNDYGVGMSEKTMPQNTERIEAILPPAIFFFDSPFTFWLRDRDTDVVLLAGHFATPFPEDAPR